MTILISFLLAIVGIFVKGFVISLFWDWFIASTFSVQSISFMQAIGLSFVVSVFTVSLKDIYDDTEDTIKNQVIMVLAYLLMIVVASPFSLFI
jgi:hypothetical protein